MNGRVFYVGSAFDVERRFGQHMNESTYYSGKNLNKYLNSMGCTPTIEVVDEIVVRDKKESLWLEKYWIDQFRQWGFGLTNSQHNLCKLPCIEKILS